MSDTVNNREELRNESNEVRDPRSSIGNNEIQQGNNRDTIFNDNAGTATNSIRDISSDTNTNPSHDVNLNMSSNIGVDNSHASSGRRSSSHSDDYKKSDGTDISYGSNEPDLLESILKNKTNHHLIDRLLGCAYGQALGDAYGLSTEFETRDILLPPEPMLFRGCLPGVRRPPETVIVLDWELLFEFAG
ncbi:unnamed protein product [Adineta steineri]|uniref:Uncharacterized protein n=1 Tax=Adineta steineri TaxID=433720 RepID=A0A814DCM5_9BILA|nr:unnamed protein product [Adineta steineri]